MEICVGCGAEAQVHPIVGIAKESETKNWFRKNKPERMVALPVCKACWTNPENRTNPIKAHFFPRESSTLALQMAELMLIKSQRGEDLIL